MTKTLNPTITVTVSGLTGLIGNRTLYQITRITDALKIWYGDEIAVNIQKSEDVNSCCRELPESAFNHHDKPVRGITVDDLIDRPVPVHIQRLMSMLGISFKEFKETDLQPVVDLVNWALTTPPVPEQKIQTDKKGNEYSSRNPNCLSGVTNKDKKNAPQVTLLAQEDIIQRVVESVIALLDYRKQQQIYHEELAEKIRKEILNLHNRPG